MRQRMGWIAFCVVLLVVLGSFAFGQARQTQGVPTSPQMATGTDLRFVLTGMDGGVALGFFEAKINGNWVRAQPVDAQGRAYHPLTLR